MLDVALLDCQVSLLTYISEYFLVGGLVSGPQGSGHETLIPYRAYRAKDYYFTIACFNDKHWKAACQAMGREDLMTNPMFSNGIMRYANKDMVNETLENIFLTKTIKEWGELFNRFEVPWAPINTIDRTLSDPQVLARNMVVEVNHPVRGSYKSVGNPIKISETAETFDPVPLAGQHTREIMAEVLHYNREVINQLFSEGAIGEQSEKDLEEIQKKFSSLDEQTRKEAGQGMETTE